MSAVLRALRRTGTGPLLLCALLGAGPAAAREVTADDTAHYVFGIVPQRATARLARSWVPLLQYLGAQTGDALRFETAPSIPEFERRLATGAYDLAYMNPYHYTVFHREPGYRAFARERGKRLRGILVVRAGSLFQRLSDLDGEPVAFPAPAAFAASLLTRAALGREGVTVQPRYVGSHDSVYLAVAKGLLPAGGGVRRTLALMAPEVRSRLRVLWTSAGYTAHAFATHPRVPAQVVARLRAAMIDLSRTPAGRERLLAVGFEGVQNARDADWDGVRVLDLQRLTGGMPEPG